MTEITEKVEVTQEWVEDSNGEYESYGWENKNQFPIIKEITITDFDKFGRPIKGYYIKHLKTAFK